MAKMWYCEKCGRIRHFVFLKKCKNCGTKVKLLSSEMKQSYNIFNDDFYAVLSKLRMLYPVEEEKKIVEELISRQNNFILNEVANNPLFSMEEYENEIEKQRQFYYRTLESTNKQISERQAKNLQVMQREKDRQNCIPKCPICGSTNIKKIAFGTRAAKTAMFGTIGAIDDAGKTYSCKNCGSKF